MLSLNSMNGYVSKEIKWHFYNTIICSQKDKSIYNSHNLYFLLLIYCILLYFMINVLSEIKKVKRSRKNMIWGI